MSLSKEPLPRKVCLMCSEPFAPRRGHQKFCSSPCRLAKWLKDHPRISLVKDDK